MKTLARTLVALALLAPALLAATGGVVPLPPPVAATPAVSAPEPSVEPSDPDSAVESSAGPSATSSPSPAATSSPATASSSSPPLASTSSAAPTTAPAARRPRAKLAPGFAPRGSILDRTGQVLVSDSPCWDVGLRHELVAAKADPEAEAPLRAYLLRVATQQAHGPHGAEGPSPERLAAGLSKHVEQTWAEISAVSGVADEELTRRAQRAAAQVERMKAAVKRARGAAREIAEEHGYHVVARVFGAAAGERLTEHFKKYPWVRLSPSSSRFAPDAEALVHVLGQVGRADEKRAAADPFAKDPERALAVGDPCGVSGVERLADASLRPWMDDAGKPHHGGDVTLTLDAALQRDLYHIVERAVKKSPSPCGGAAVVIDVATGELRALVSYPAHGYDLSTSEARTLLADARWTPMRFRAVSSQFPPGSTIKPVTLYTALAAGAVTPDTRVTCSGTFKKEIPDAFRCWVFNKTGGNHGVEIGETALRDSCNIYFYTAGDKLGATPIIDELAKIGLGTTQGTGLIEESPGILPTAEWLAGHRKKAAKYQRADAWNYAFGQGELTVTPLQMANIAATLARGRFEPVTLAKDGARRLGIERAPGPALSEQWLETVRRGLWRVVNEKGGTADVAKLGIPQAVLCGKTGSAQAVSRVIKKQYDFTLADGSTRAVTAGTLEVARAAVPAGARLVSQKVLERFPETEDDELPSHAWFIGYTQDPRTPRGAKPSGTCYALSVLVEYGGGGGAVAAPIARDVARRLFAAQSPSGDSASGPAPEATGGKRRSRAPLTAR